MDVNDDVDTDDFRSSTFTKVTLPHTPCQNPPPRVHSFSSLIGETYLNSCRTNENFNPGSYSDDENTTPPSVHMGLVQLSPPPLNPRLDPFLMSSASSVHTFPNLSSIRGRPPRAPVALPSTQKAQKQTHLRVQSSGEISFMSALTDSFNEEVKLRPRGLSWESPVFDIPQIAESDALLHCDSIIPSSLQQPILSDDLPRSILTSTLEPTTSLDIAIDTYDFIKTNTCDIEWIILLALESRECYIPTNNSSIIFPSLSKKDAESLLIHHGQHFPEFHFEPGTVEAKSFDERKNAESALYSLIIQLQNLYLKNLQPKNSSFKAEDLKKSGFEENNLYRLDLNQPSTVSSGERAKISSSQCECKLKVKQSYFLQSIRNAFDSKIHQINFSFQDTISPMISLRVQNLLCWLIVLSMLLVGILIALRSGILMNSIATKQCLSAKVSGILWITIRQLIFILLSKITELFLMSIVHTKMNNLLACWQLWSLLILQSKGWSNTVAIWASYNLINAILLGNHADPEGSGNIQVSSQRLRFGKISASFWTNRFMTYCLVALTLLSLKRLLLGYYLGHYYFKNYICRLAFILRKIILIGQVSNLGRQLEIQKCQTFQDSQYSPNDTEGTCMEKGFGSRLISEEQIFDNLITNRAKIQEILSECEQPSEKLYADKISINGILLFKQALALLDHSFPFSKSFGKVKNRISCIKLAGEAYQRLILVKPNNQTLNFETICLVAKCKTSGKLDKAKVRELKQIFRPDHDGTVDIMAFILSIDRAYKDIRFLQASLHRYSQIHRIFIQAFGAFSSIFILLGILIISHGEQLLMLIAIAGIWCIFSFILYHATRKFFEGMLFLLHIPYNIGDLISFHGKDEQIYNQWLFVEDISPFYTTFRFRSTNQKMSIPNYTLVSVHLVIANESENAVISFKLKLSVETDCKKLETLQSGLKAFIKSKPKEWLSCSTMHLTKVDIDAGFDEYCLTLKHCESWREIDIVVKSKASLERFCLQLGKTLKISVNCFS